MSRLQDIYPGDRVSLREVGLRDGLQLVKQIPATEAKQRWLREEYAAGVRHFEVGSFLPAKTFPQFVDVRDIVATVASLPGAHGVALALNERGAEIPTPPFWGSRVIREMPLEIVLDHLDIDELYRLQWGAKNTHGDEWTKLKAEFDARLDRMKREAIKSGYLKPQAVYGYFPAQSSGEALIVYDPQLYASSNGQKSLREIARFEFPRQPGQDHLCLADYFEPIDSGVIDTVALQVVTVGHSADEKFAELQGKHDYSEAYFLHGLGVEAAEATAEVVHQHIRRELNIGAKHGKRYSWGYPACPDIADHAKVFALLPQTSELGLELTSAYQLIPEQSTAAIVVHHPAAKYYSTGVNRVEQLMGEA